MLVALYRIALWYLYDVTRLQTFPPKSWFGGVTGNAIKVPNFARKVRLSPKTEIRCVEGAHLACVFYVLALFSDFAPKECLVTGFSCHFRKRRFPRIEPGSPAHKVISNTNSTRHKLCLLCSKCNNISETKPKPNPNQKSEEDDGGSSIVGRERRRRWSEKMEKMVIVGDRRRRWWRSRRRWWWSSEIVGSVGWGTRRRRWLCCRSWGRRLGFHGGDDGDELLYTRFQEIRHQP